MKKKLLFLSMLFVCLVISGCNNSNTNITMTIKENTLTRNGMTVVITDTSSNKNVFSAWFRLDKKIDNTWQELDAVNDNCVFNDIAYYTDETNKLEMEQDTSCMYGELDTGEYRLVKYTLPKDKIGNIIEKDKTYFNVEFKID